jgi:tRNA/rRNA methyltransferase
VVLHVSIKLISQRARVYFGEKTSARSGMNLRVVLVEPMYDGNIGSVARSMKNFGFDQLVLVNPCRIDDFGNAMASHAKDILDKAKVVPTLEGALDGAGLVVGTTGKRLGDEHKHLRLHIREPWLTPAQLAEKLNGKDCDVALLLGRENWGLTNQELQLCNLLVSIPTSSSYPIMNLAHAATIILYELSRVDPGGTPLAGPETLERLQVSARSLLDEINYPSHKREFRMMMFKRIFGRAELTEREANTLLGMLKLIRWQVNNNDDNNRSQVNPLNPERSPPSASRPRG